MRYIPTSVLVGIFGTDVPMLALELIEQAGPDLTNDQLIATMQLMQDARTDKRVGPALAVAKSFYILPGKTFEESQPGDAGGKLTAHLVQIIVEIFKDMDARSKGQA